MRWNIIFNYNLKKFSKELLGAYSSIITFYLIVVILFKNYDGTFSFSGIEVITNIVLFILVTEVMATGFKLSQSFNLSRSEFIKGNIIFLTFISFVTAIVDIIINKIVNIYINSPMYIDDIYVGIQQNNFETIIKLILVIFVVHITAVALGFLTVSFYRYCKYIKFGTFVFIGAVILVIFFISIFEINIFYISSGNPNTLLLNTLIDLVIGIIMYIIGSLFLKKTPSNY